MWMDKICPRITNALLFGPFGWTKQVKPGFTNYLPRVLANKIIFLNKNFRNFSKIWRKKIKKFPEYQKTKFHVKKFDGKLKKL